MDAPIEELRKIQQLQEAARALLEAGKLDEALQRVEEALALEAQNLKTLTLKAEIHEGRGELELAGRLRQQVKMRKREIWQGQVEAEIRGQHEMLGGPIKHETL
jgi:Flp pilus assembly protein TadD